MRRIPERTTEDVLDEHLDLRRRGDLEADLRRNYAEDVVLMTTHGSFRGHDGVRESNAMFMQAFAQADTRVERRATTGELAVIRWSARPDPAVVVSGEETLLIRNGKIVIQTIQVDLEPAAN